MKNTLSKLFPIAIVSTALAAAAGCSFQGGVWRAFDNDVKIVSLSEDSTAMNRNYTSKLAPKTNSIAVEYIAPNTSIAYSVNDTDFLGNARTVANFYAGKIIAEAFRKIADANFSSPGGNIPACAKFSVSIDRVSEKIVSSNITSYVEVSVKLEKSNTKEIAYSKSFESSKISAWDSSSGKTPQSFYMALNDILDQFLADWEQSAGCAKLEEWAGVGKTVKPPELGSLEFTEQDSVYLGRCIVLCNTYEPFRAKAWADTQISVECRRKLGIEPERVRIVYDTDTYDPNSKTWTLEFRTFARTEKVLSFNKNTRHGFVTGDLGLMNLPAEEAASELRKFVTKEMNSYVGVVTSEVEGAEAFVRFDDFTTDKLYNLITIKFRLVN